MAGIGWHWWMNHYEDKLGVPHGTLILISYFGIVVIILVSVKYSGIIW